MKIITAYIALHKNASMEECLIFVFRDRGIHISSNVSLAGSIFLVECDQCSGKAHDQNFTKVGGMIFDSLAGDFRQFVASS